MDIVAGPALQVVYVLLDLFKWALIIHIILGWLVAFNVINTSNRFVYLVGDFLNRLTEPVLRPFRKVIPPLGGLDISPILVFVAIMFLQGVLVNLMRTL